MKKPVIISVVILILLVAVTASSLYITSMPRFCNTCHEMNNNYSAWKISAHKGINCEKCHLKIGAKNYAIGKIAALKEVYDHFTGNYPKPINGDGEVSIKMPSDNCQRCHPNPGVKKKDNVTMDHSKHKMLAFTCAYCHNRTAHPGLSGHPKRIVMAFCVDCHKKEKATIACASCHYQGFRVKPASHNVPNWLQVHQNEDLSVCSFCHRDKAAFCDKCHSQTNPHPKNWLSIHEGIAESRGTAKCYGCHEKKFCQDCHARSED